MHLEKSGRWDRTHELVERVMEAFDIDVQTAQQDVGRFLEELLARGLIEVV